MILFSLCDQTDVKVFKARLFAIVSSDVSNDEEQKIEIKYRREIDSGDECKNGDEHFKMRVEIAKRIITHVEHFILFFFLRE